MTSMQDFINQWDVSVDSLSIENYDMVNLEESMFKKLWPPRTSNIVRCPACRRKSRKYSCADCISNKTLSSTGGNGLHPRYQKRLALKERIFKLENTNSLIHQLREEKILADEIDKLNEQIARKKEQLKKRKCKEYELINTLQMENDTVERRQKRLLQFCERLKLFTKLVDNKEKSIEKKTKSFVPMEKSLQAEVQYQISQVFKIIPLSLFSPKILNTDNTVNVTSLLTCIEDGVSTSYLKDEWEITHQFEVDDVIGKVYNQLLPADGKYYEFHKNNRNDQDCYNIPIGLSYLVQVVNLVAYYTDVILPRSMSFTDFIQFDGTNFNTTKFHEKIYNLNGNILTLCLSQGVPLKFLHPNRAIPNLIALMFHPSVSLGRFKAVTHFGDSHNNNLKLVEIPYFMDTDDELSDDKYVGDGWEKLTTNI